MARKCNLDYKLLLTYRKASDLLSEEAKKMEEKLEAVKKMMELEKEKRS